MLPPARRAAVEAAVEWYFECSPKAIYEQDKKMSADWSPREVRTGVVIRKSNDSYVGEYADAIRFLNWCITLYKCSFGRCV